MTKDEDLALALEEAHKVLDEDDSKIIRNAKDGYPEGRPDRELTLAERVKALCVYAADWKRWCLENEAAITAIKQAQQAPEINKIFVGQPFTMGGRCQMHPLQIIPCAECAKLAYAQNQG